LFRQNPGLPVILYRETMKQKDFRNILKKYRQGNATAEEKRLIDLWYDSLEKDVQPDITDEFGLEIRLWSRIKILLLKSGRRDNTRKLINRYAVGIAASLVVSVAVFHFYISYPNVENVRIAGKQEASFFWKNITNTKKIPELIVLPDKSKVTIEPGTKLKYSSVFNEVSREIYLEGEAFFEVSKNAQRPFLVYANEVTTKVLGTSFRIKALQQEKEVTIAVKTGKVSVFTNNKNEKLMKAEEIILTPNQQVVFDKKEKKISKKRLVDKPQVILPDEDVNRMRFNEAPVAEIFRTLEKLYGVEIVFDEKKLSSCELTTIISDNDIYNRLNIICNAIGASYVLENGTIIINSTGCN
jgi:transmembrane sensor